MTFPYPCTLYNAGAASPPCTSTHSQEQHRSGVVQSHPIRPTRGHPVEVFAVGSEGSVHAVPLGSPGNGQPGEGSGT